MSSTELLDSQINKVAYLSAVALFVLTAISMFGVHDAPAGSTIAEKAAWLDENIAVFLISWVNQILQVFTLSIVFGAVCWKIYSRNPLAAILGGAVVMIGATSILLTKSTELWVIPLAAQDLAAGSTGKEAATMLLSINSQSYPYSLTTFYDYQGLWLWSVFGLVVARPLFPLSTSSKVASICLGVYGVLYQVFLAFTLTGSIPQDEITAYSTFMLLIWIAAFAMGGYCWGATKSPPGREGS